MSDLGTQANINDVYRERNLAVSLAFAIAYEASYDVAAYADPADPDWVVVFIETGVNWQYSWHLSRAEFDEFLPGFPLSQENPWDGHSTQEKERRIKKYISTLGLSAAV